VEIGVLDVKEGRQLTDGIIEDEVTPMECAGMGRRARDGL
jgi:hypothetical protein